MKIIYSILSLLIGSNALACTNIIGTWKSSAKMSMKYNIENANLKPEQIEFLEQILGILKITYTESEIHSHGAPTINLTIKDENHEFHFDDFRFKYEILLCTKKSIITKQYYPYSKPATIKLNFVDEDTYWVSSDTLPSSREYFVRHKQ